MERRAPDDAHPYALFRESTTKDKRAVPLRPKIVEQFKALRPKPEETHTLSKPIFWFRWPTYDLLRGDFRPGGIERVVQEALGHSDAKQTAMAYADVPALAPHTELAKLPWIDATSAANALADPHTGSAQPAPI